MSSELKFREVIRPPFWLIAFIYFMLFSLVLAIWAAFNDSITLISAAFAIVLGVLAIILSTKTIVVDHNELRIGKAHIPLVYLGESTIVTEKEFIPARTRDADPAAYFALTFWISQGLKVEINDDRDPTPYWLISTKRARELQTALKN